MSKSSFDIEVYYDYVVVEKWAEVSEEITAGGIIKLTNTNANPIVCSKVVAIGHGQMTPHGEIVPLKTEVGDLIYFNKFTAQFSVEKDHEDFFFLHEKDIMGRIPADKVIDNENDEDDDDDNEEEEIINEEKEIEEDEKTKENEKELKQVDVTVQAPTLGLGTKKKR